MEAFGPLHKGEIARKVGIKRGRDLERRHLEPLAELGLVEDRGDGVWALPGDYRENSAGVRQLRYSTVRRVRRRHRTPEGRTVVEVVHIGSIASAEERRTADAEQHKRDSEAYRNRHKVKPEPTPTYKEMRERRESVPDRRREAIKAAVARLFAERPEYRTRRPGQVTCALVNYLSADFPRGTEGFPKDAEVEELLEGVAA